MPPLGGSSSEIAEVFGGKTRMAWLLGPGGEKSLRTCSLVSTQYANVTDTQRDRRTSHDGIGRADA